MKKQLLFVLLIVFSASFAHAIDQYYFENQEYMYISYPDEAAEKENIQTAGLATSNIEAAPSGSIVTMDGQVSENTIKALSVEAMISDNIQTYNIPVSYGFPLSLTGNKELLNLKIVLPWTMREVGNKKDSGLGDITFTANYLIRFPQLLLDSKLVIKAPTGELEDADVPLGTGSTDSALFVNGTYYFKNFSLKGGLGYGYNGDTDITNIDKISYGDEFIISGGGDYNINDTMKAGAIIVYKNRAEDKIVLTSDPANPQYNPGINTLEITPSFTYLWKTYNAEFNASLMIPVADSWNTDKADKPPIDPDRSIKFNIGVSKPF